MSSQLSVQFKNLEISARRVDVVVSADSEEHSLYFEFDRAIEPSTSEIAHALSTLCGKKYAQVDFAFEIPRETIDEIRDFTGADVTALPTEPGVAKESFSGNVLSFSGGFDSMVAKALMPEETHLVSIDFGGWFTREAEFFKQFSPIIVSTNARRVPSQKTSFARNHWGFMAIGAILTRGYLGARYHTFGSILGGEFSAPGSSRVRLKPLENIGLIDAPYTNGITELGTAKIMTMAYPDLLAESIESLAGKRDRKRFLKIALLHGVTDDRQVLESIPPAQNSWGNPVAFDSSYTTALGALALYSQGRGELIEPLFDSVPEDSIEFAKEIDFSFMQKVNWDKHTTLEPQLHADFWTKLTKYGFSPYTEQDWANVRAVREHLNGIFTP